MLPLDSCTCAVTPSGSPAGCASLSVRDTPYGPRFSEAPCGPGAPRGDSLRFDATREGAPDGAVVWKPAEGLRVDAHGMLSKAPPSGRFDATKEGAPDGALWYRR